MKHLPHLLGLFCLCSFGSSHSAFAGNAPWPRRDKAARRVVEVDEGKGYTDEDLPLKPTPGRPWEEETPPVSGPLVRRVRAAGRDAGGKGVWKWVERDWPQGFLSGKTIFLSPGHGWYWTGSSWTTQRGNSYGIVEDLSNAESVDQFLVSYLVRAGAHVVPVREIDLTAGMLVCDDGDRDLFPEDCLYGEEGSTGLFSDSTLPGYGRISYPVSSGVNPFEQGGNRLLQTDIQETARFVWTLNVPQSDYYNVYVSYSSYSLRAPDAHYIVSHPGGEAHFRVDQRHHGGTWVLLGRFWFERGLSRELGSVALANDSENPATDVTVSADAVRIGGGMGLTDRGGGSSLRPRYEECCRYHAQFSGAPAAVYDPSTSGDNTDDVSCRSRMAAWVHEPGEDALYFSWHSNAGGGTGTSIYVYGEGGPGECVTPSPSAGSVELADLILAEVISDIRTVWDPSWTNRGRRCAWFGELNPSNNNEMPAALIELAFHDLPADIEDLREPEFRKISARAIYKGMVRYFAWRDSVPARLLPEPPQAVCLRHTDACSLEVTWRPPGDDPAGGDPPLSYRVYTSRDGRAFDEGTDTAGATSFSLVDLDPGSLVYVQVTAVNEGGESLPSRTLAAAASGWPRRVPVLMVQGFGRLDSSQLQVRYENPVLGHVDRMIVSRMNDGSYLLRHAPEMASFGAAFDSCEDQAVAEGDVELSGYEAVDFLAGRGADSAWAVLPEVREALAAYLEGGGRLLISGSHLASELSSGTAEEQAFLVDLLGVQQGTGVPSYTVEGEGILSSAGSMALEEDYGAAGGYDVALTGTVAPASAEAAEICRFDGAQGPAAGIRNGQGGSGSTVLLDFPLEGILDRQKRAAVLSAVASHFGVEPVFSTSCQEPDGQVMDGQAPSDGGHDGADAGQGPECRACPCETGCGCRSHEMSREGSTGWIIWFGLLLLMAWSAAARRKKERDR